MRRDNLCRFVVVKNISVLRTAYSNVSLVRNRAAGAYPSQLAQQRSSTTPRPLFLQHAREALQGAAITLASGGGRLSWPPLLLNATKISRSLLLKSPQIPQTLLSFQANEILATIRPFVSTRVLRGSQGSGHTHRHTYTSEPCTSPGLASLPTRLDRWIRCSTNSTHREEAEDRVALLCMWWSHACQHTSRKLAVVGYYPGWPRLHRQTLQRVFDGCTRKLTPWPLLFARCAAVYQPSP